MKLFSIKELESFAADEIKPAHARLMACQLADTMRENEENCRLLGMSSEREAALLAENERLSDALQEITETDWAEERGNAISRIQRVACEALRFNAKSIQTILVTPTEWCHLKIQE